MRILIKLRAIHDCAYDIKYHHKLQGFIYSLLRDTPYSILHNKSGYKFISFSNIFPPNDMKKGNIRQLIISSPDKVLINVIREKLEQVKENVCIGEMMFEIEGASMLEPRLERSCTLITGTPIIIRISRKNYEEYGINPPKDYDYVYWRKRYSFEAFIKQLEANLFKKYNEYYKTKLEEFGIFEQFMFKKEVCNHIIIDGKEQMVFGSIWEFIFTHLDKEKRKILEPGLDAGFGELNSMGFGFMNVKK